MKVERLAFVFVDKDDISVTIDKTKSVSLNGGTLVISGKKEKVIEDKENNSYSERIYGSFHREMRLPDSVDSNSASVNLRNGILDVSFGTIDNKEIEKQNILKLEVKSDGDKEKIEIDDK